MDAITSQTTIVYSTVYSGADQRKHQSSASLVFVWGIHRWPVNSPHKRPVTRKMFPFDDVIMLGGIQSMSRNDAHWSGFVKCCYWLSINCVSINRLCFTALSSFDNDWLKKDSWTWISRSHSLSNQNNTSFNKTRGLTHWGRVTHICVGNLTIIGSDHDLSPGRRQAIIWTHTGISLIGRLGTNFSEIWIKIHIFLLKKMQLKRSTSKYWPFRLGPTVLTHLTLDKMAAIWQTTFSKAFSWMTSFVFRFKFHWSSFLRVKLTISQHWFRWWLGAKQSTSHYLNQCWPSSLTHICGTRGRWVKGLPHTFSRIQPPNAETLH